MPTAVIALADFEPASHAAATAMSHAVPYLEQAGWEVVVLRGSEATPENLYREVQYRNPILIIGEGHGAPEVFTLQDKKVTYTCTAAPGVTGRVVFLQSCETGQRLGPCLVGRFGASAYYGYTKDFLWVQADPSADPLEDKLGRYFYQAPIAAIGALASGASVGEAYQLAKRVFQSNLHAAEISIDVASPLVAFYLRNDLQAWVSLGDPALRLNRKTNTQVVEWVPEPRYALLAVLPPLAVALAVRG